MITRIYLVHPFTIEETQTEVKYMDFDSELDVLQNGISSDGIFIPFANICMMFTTDGDKDEIQKEDSVSERATE